MYSAGFTANLRNSLEQRSQHIGRKEKDLNSRLPNRDASCRAATTQSARVSVSCHVSLSDPYCVENVHVNIQSSLVNAGREGGVQTLGKAFGDSKLVRYHRELRIALEGLRVCCSRKLVSLCHAVWDIL